MGKPAVDYSVYLVTGRELLPAGKDYYESLEEALAGGVTVVQVREKDADTGEFVEVAKRTKAVCDKYGVPVLVNDRVDVYLASGCAGVHVGQSDMSAAEVRALIGADAVLGVSVSSEAEAKRAVADGADYVGIGAVWATASKDVTAKPKLAPSGVGHILDTLVAAGGEAVRSVAIGGIHALNVSFLLHGSVGPRSGKALDGVAVISAIVGAQDPKPRAEELRGIVDSFKRSREGHGADTPVFPTATKNTAAALVDAAAHLFDVVRSTTPLVHQITNAVVINDSANATLAIGASPIMATNPRDVHDLSPIIGALLINFGTITDKEGMFVAGRQANVNRKPLVFDPVAVGATAFRRETSKELLAHWQPTVIKGNAAEIAALSESKEVLSRGVDSVGSGFADPPAVVRALARQRRAIVVLTGVHDYISDGNVVLKASNGHELLGVITGSGCMTGSLVATFCAAARSDFLASHDAVENDSRLVQGDMLVGALAGVLAMNIAAERAAEREDCRGPGTFRAALMDELYAVRPADVLARANVEVV